MSTTEKRPVIEVTGLKKQYKLGQIGGGTVTAWSVAYSLVFTAAALVLGVVLFSRIEKTFMDTV